MVLAARVHGRNQMVYRRFCAVHRSISITDILVPFTGWQTRQSTGAEDYAGIARDRGIAHTGDFRPVRAGT